MPETARRLTLGRVLDDAARVLERAGIERPRREAAALWGELTAGLTAAEVWLLRETAADRAAVRRFREAVRRRAGGVPFAYVVGRTSFRRLTLTLDPRALIPRPETEGLVDIVLDWMRGAQSAANGRGTIGGVAADVGTGCGCLALALATEGAFARVIAVERSPGAAALARENVALVAPAVPVEVREGSLLGPLEGERCRVLVSNPPYLTEAEYERLDESVRRFEPREALVSGADGLEATRALLGGAMRVMEPGGLLVLEVDERRAEAVAGLARAAGWRGVTIRQDLFGRARYAVATAAADGNGGNA